MSAVAATAVNWTESGFVPDSVIRRGIRRLLRSRLAAAGANEPAASADRQAAFVELMDRSAVALLPQLANEQHYEVPCAFFETILGVHCKYSCGYWPEGVATLTEAEEAALGVTCERAGILDGMQVLDLGCGWGSLSLWVASRFPASRVTAVSNSAVQRDFIRSRAASAALTNIDVHVCDMNDFDIDCKFDRIVSIEMFEHMRNWRELLRRVSGWLAPGGAFFMHVFCHRSTPYEFIDRGPGDWISRHFFSGGMMPSDSLPYCFQDELRLERQWRWSGQHYARTANAWLQHMDERKSRLMPILEQCYGRKEARKWWMRWRMFFMACEELFAFDDGQEWWVSHYRFVSRGAGSRAE
jgi:cyclopropane-fatty-acyl-phospholipid synthase